VTLNGVAFGTWDTRGATQSQFRPTLYKVTNVPAGQQTIAGTVTNIGASNEFLDYAQFPSPNPPIVIVMTQNRVLHQPVGHAHDRRRRHHHPQRAHQDDDRDRVPERSAGCDVDADAIINKNALYFGDGAAAATSSTRTTRATA
jgi:hypothetical protein